MRTLGIAAALAAVAAGQTAALRPASKIDIPLHVDGNSPSVWLNGEWRYFTSTGKPVTAGGGKALDFAWKSDVTMTRSQSLPAWFESVWADDDGTLYAWYHHEPGGVCPGNSLTAPIIGAAVSHDGGKTFHDLGSILVSGDAPDCDAKNGFFATGHGDFSVILDRGREYFYFFFTSYGGDLRGQGVAVARMAFADRIDPVGRVFKFHEENWDEPGVKGKLTPIFPAVTAWQKADTKSHWGPAVHFNTYLEQYVVLLNHACCAPEWPQEGIYVSFSPTLKHPTGWTRPALLLNQLPVHPGFYPQVLGMEAGESDSRAGQVARFFLHGHSQWEIVFRRPNESPEEAEKIEEPPTEESAIEIVKPKRSRRSVN
ncbi:MAG: hypothetical protein SFV18_03495 [Bryobacteraceae bacterium]|nr:hypothetical protein [Bryobacteraceae bacterium]